MLGIRIGSASNVYYNTIVINNISTTGGGTQATSAIVTFTSSLDIRNNIMITEEDDFVNYCIYGTPGTSDFNNFYRSGTTNARIGFSVSARATLEDWQAATNLDANSNSIAVNFVSATDLHLSGTSLGNVNLIGTPLAAPFNVDIDGEGRHLFTLILVRMKMIFLFQLSLLHLPLQLSVQKLN